MTTSNPSEISFNGIRLRFDSKKRFDKLVSALLTDRQVGLIIGNIMIDVLKRSPCGMGKTIMMWGPT